MSTGITYATTLEIQRETVEEFARLPAAHRVRIGTRKATRRLGPFKKAVLVIRWFLDGTRVRHLWADNDISRSTAYTYLHEGIDVFAAAAPDLLTVLQEAERPASPSEPGRHRDPHRPGEHTRTQRGRPVVVGQAQAPRRQRPGRVAPDGWPLWVSDVRPGREHDTTCAKAATGLLDGLERAERDGMPTLTDLGYENLSPALRTSVKKPKGRELSEPAKAYNALIRGIHAPSERANSLLKTTFKAMRRISLDPGASATSPKQPSSCSASSTPAPCKSAAQRRKTLLGKPQ